MTNTTIPSPLPPSVTSTPHDSSDSPQTAKLLALLMQSMGIDESDPRVTQMLLEFAHRYIIDTLHDSLLYSDHAGRTEIDIEDVKLAIQSRVNYSFATPPPKDFLLEQAKEKNSIPLPLVGESLGLRLPPEQFCLTSVNYQIVPQKQNIATSKQPQASQLHQQQQPDETDSEMEDLDALSHQDEDAMNIDTNAASNGAVKMEDIQNVMSPVDLEMPGLGPGGAAKVRGEEDDYDF
ncbi:transcription initiation factor IID, 31kD subunit-domain-containing protein [Paraphysoderma sedebokerense]|nr:transcription initiation factor IID, 31kD subunit-domain-containing protein [Paraphysoderma sedebokerense]